MWPVRRSLASRKPRTDMSELECGLDVGSAEPAESLQARSPHIQSNPKLEALEQAQNHSRSVKRY